MDMPEKIKYHREKLGLTLEELGKRVGVGKSTVRKWETGMIANMRRDKIEKVAMALNISPAYLMGWDDHIKPQDLAPLRPDESTLLGYYNLLNDKGKDKAQEYVSDLTENRKYVASDPEPLLYAAHERTDIEVTDEMRKHDDDIMSDDKF